MGETIRIGSWQGSVVENDVDQNLAKVRAVLAEARDLNLDFICFPETFLSGYSTEAARGSAVALTDPRFVAFVEESHLYDTVVIVGMIEQQGTRRFNSVLVIYQGQLLGIYHKTMLTGYDAQLFETDVDLPVFKAKGITFGVVICHDTSFVEPALGLRWQGARLLFTPHFNQIAPEGFRVGRKKVSFWEHRRMVLNNQAALATLLKMVVVRSNVVGVSSSGLSAGDSNIWDMDGMLVAEGTPFTEAIVTADFDKAIFLEEHWIDRREVPVELLETIARAAQDYNRQDEDTHAMDRHLTKG